MVVPGGAAVSVAWRGTPRKGPKPERLEPLGVMAWAWVFVALALWELAALLLQPTLTTSSYAHPTISFIVDPILASHLHRSIALSIWLGMGWFLLGR